MRLRLNLTFVLGLLICGRVLMPMDALAAETAVVDRILAVVNEDIITQYDVESIMLSVEQNLRQQRMSPERERQALSEVRRDMLSNLIDTKLTEQEVKRYNIAVTEEEIDNYIKQFKQRNSLSDAQFLAMLPQQGYSMEEYRKEVKLQLQRTKLVNREVRSRIVITQAEIKEHYEKNRAKYGGGTQYHLWNLFVKLPPAAAESDQQAAKDLIGRAQAELKAGRPFPELARLAEDGRDGIQGTDLGLFRIEDLTPQLREVVRGLKTGQFSAIVASDFGYQIVYVQSIRDSAAKPLAQVETEIQDILYREKVDSRFQTWLSELRKRSHIKVMEAP